MKTCLNCGYQGEADVCPECGAKTFDLEAKIADEEPANDQSLAEDTVPEMADNVQLDPVQTEEDKAEEENDAELETELRSEAEEDADQSDGAVTDTEQGNGEDILDFSEVDTEGEYDTPSADDSKEFAAKAKAMELSKGVQDIIKKANFKKILKISGIVAGAIVLVCVAIAVIGIITKDSMKHDMEETAKQTIHSLNYSVPKDWKVNENNTYSHDVDFAALEKKNEEHKDDSDKDKTEKKTAEGTDSDFIKDIAEGLQLRWEQSDGNDEPTADEMHEYAQIELDEIEKYETATFKDSELQGMAVQYIDCLKKSLEIELSPSEDDGSWGKIYAQRTFLVKQFKDYYGLTTDKKYQKDLEDFVFGAYGEKACYERYNDDGELTSVLLVNYLGDDLTDKDIESCITITGVEEVDSRSEQRGDCDIKITQYQTNQTDDEDGTNFSLAIANVDYSTFAFLLKSNSEVYDADTFDAIIAAADFEGYKNPRTPAKLEAKFTGSREPGKTIKTGSKGVKVLLTYKDGGTERPHLWSLDKEMTLEEGKKCEGTISCHGMECTLKTSGRKPVKLKVKYTGDTDEGTYISDDDLTVKVVYDTGEKEVVTDYEYDDNVKLKAGKTSIVNIKYKNLKYKLKVKCTTLTKEQYKAQCVTRNYSNLLRNPTYGKYIKIYGRVLQDCGSGKFRISSSGAYDNVFMVCQVDENIIEGDWVTVYGTTEGVSEYTTVLGASMKIPEIFAEYVDR